MNFSFKLQRREKKINVSFNNIQEGQMGIISWIILGLIAGAIAKWLMPGKDGSGIIMTMILGIVGAFVGGFLGSLAGFGTPNGLNIGSIITAIVGALIVLFVYNKIIRK